MNASTVKAEVTHYFRVKPDIVFDAWLTGEKIRKWFGPGLGEMTRIAVDAREGGAFSFVQRRGTEEVDHTGKYLEFQRPYRLAFTWHVKGTADESKVFIQIANIPSGAELHLTHELGPAWEHYREKTEAAWTKMLDAMAKAIEGA